MTRPSSRIDRSVSMSMSFLKSHTATPALRAIGNSVRHKVFDSSFAMVWILQCQAAGGGYHEAGESFGKERFRSFFVVGDGYEVFVYTRFASFRYDSSIRRRESEIYIRFGLSVWQGHGQEYW